MSKLIRSGSEKQTILWGGALARMTSSEGKWLGIPTGHLTINVELGTSILGPDTDFNPTTTADDLCSVIWQSLHSIRISGCRMFYGQGGGDNTAHVLCLMRYDIDGNGTLSNGVAVAGPDTDLGVDDYTTLAHRALTMTSNTDVDSSSQVLIALVFQTIDANVAFSAKCIIEYRKL